MGTRSLTTFIDDHTEEEIVVMYRQYDGYPGGHGRELLNFLNRMKFDNQLTYGISCLAAQVISHFKKESGGFYLHAGDTRDWGEEFVYTIYSKDNELKVKIEDVYNDKVMFDGNIKKMDKWIGKIEDAYDDNTGFDNIESAIKHGKIKIVAKKMSNSLVRQKEDGFTD